MKEETAMNRQTIIISILFACALLVWTIAAIRVFSSTIGEREVAVQWREAVVEQSVRLEYTLDTVSYTLDSLALRIDRLEAALGLYRIPPLTPYSKIERPVGVHIRGRYYPSTGVTGVAESTFTTKRKP
jgi:hypothetical protein